MTDRAALVLIGVPIGNLGDLSPRAAAELAGVDLLCCEDTRRTGQLLSLVGIDRPPLTIVNDHNEAARCDEIVARLGVGERVGLVSDAGMPGVSDPGARIVAAVAAAGYRVEVIPGPSAGIAALIASGLAPGRFCFEGFLPRKGSARGQRLAEIANENRTTILYEAPHRLERTLTDLAVVVEGTRRLVVARELTKLHEELWRGTLTEALGWVADHPPRGEIVVLLDAAPPPAEPGDADLASLIGALLNVGKSKRDAVAEVAAQTGANKRRVYQVALDLDAP